MLTEQEIKRLKESRVEMEELKVLVQKVFLHADNVTKVIDNLRVKYSSILGTARRYE